MISFRVTRHHLREIDVVEVWHGDNFIATICPPPPGDNRAALTVISKHIKPGEVIIDDTKEPTVVMVPFGVQ